MLNALRNGLNKAKEVVKEKVGSLLTGTTKHFRDAYKAATYAPTLIPVQPVTPEPLKSILPGTKGIRQPKDVPSAPKTLPSAPRAVEPMVHQDVLADLLWQLENTTNPHHIEGIRCSLNTQTIRMLGISRDYKPEDNMRHLAQRGYERITPEHPMYAAACYVYNAPANQQDLWVHQSTMRHLEHYDPKDASTLRVMDFFIARLADDNIVPIVHLDEMMAMLGQRSEPAVDATETVQPYTAQLHTLRS